MRPVLAIASLTAHSSVTTGFSCHRHTAFIASTNHRVQAAVTKDLRLATKADFLLTKDLPEDKTDAFPGATIVNGKIDSIEHPELTVMRPRSDPQTTSWEGIKSQLIKSFKFDTEELDKYDEMEEKASLLEIYKAMQLARQFEVACNKQYMVRESVDHLSFQKYIYIKQ